MQSAPRQHLAQMSEYEACLVEAQRAYRRIANARGAERADAKKEYERAIARAREMAARLR